MNSDQTNKWLTFAANLGVFAGLILVAYEINQSGTHLEIAASADGADNFTQAMEVLVQDEGLSQLVYRAERSFGDLDEFERWRMSKYLDGFLVMSEQDFLLFYELDDQRSLTAFTADWRDNMALAVFQDYWRRKQKRFSPEFREFIENIIANN